MSRRQAICYLIILSVLTLALLVLLAIVSPLAMLVAILVIVIVLGLMKKYRRQFFAVFRKPQANTLAGPHGSSLPQRMQYTPNLVLVPSNLASIGQVVIDKPVFSLGRDAGCNFCITNAPDISRVHATLRYESKTTASFIVDNNSHNGTYVNGMKLTPGKPERISNGDIIQLGTIRFVAQVAHY